MSKASAIIATTLALVVGCFLGRKLASSTPPVAVHHGAPPAADVERYKIPIDGAPARGGDGSAKVTIVEFSDFECPFCSRIEPTLGELLARYGAEVRVVWKDFPLAQHRSAQAAAVAARACAQKGRFWQMHDKLFANQRDVTTSGKDAIVRLGRDAGVDVEKLLDDAALQALVRKDLEDARRFAVNATPSLFINGRPVRGRLTADALAPMIEEELANADRALAAGAPTRDLYAALTAGARTSGAQPQAQPAAAPRVAIAAGDSPARGRADAKVTVVEFSDFECPACNRAEPTVAALRAQLGDDVRLVWKNLPLTMHPHAHLAAEAAMAAGAQGKFWEMHDALFADQQHLERADLDKRAAALKLDMKRFRRALDEHTYAKAVDADAELANRAGVSGTPTFFIDGQRLPNWTELPSAAAQALGRAKQAVRPRPGRPDPGATYQALVGDAPARGPRNAKVTLVEWADYECPFCSRLATTIDALAAAHPDDVRVVYKQFPLPNHPHAQLAAEAGLCAHAQGRFWELHRAIYAHQTALDRASLDKYAAEAGLDVARFRSDLDGHKYARAVAAQAAEGQRIGVSGTPSFYLNGRFHEGADSIEQLEQKVAAALADADARIAAGTPRAKLYDAIMKTAAREVEAPPLVDKEARAVDPGAGAPSRGGKQAAVTVVEFSDFECPYCKRAADVVADVRKQYGDDVRVVFRNFPLPYHKSANLAAQASLAAHEQGKFWEMHDKLFANQAAISRTAIDGYARELGLDTAKFAAALDGGKYAAAVNADLLAGGPLVNGTPTLFVNGHKLTNPALLAQAVGEELQKRRR